MLKSKKRRLVTRIIYLSVWRKENISCQAHGKQAVLQNTACKFSQTLRLYYLRDVRKLRIFSFQKTCNITSFLRILCGLFGNVPPVYSKPPPETRSPSVAQQQTPTSSVETRAAQQQPPPTSNPPTPAQQPQGGCTNANSKFVFVRVCMQIKVSFQLHQKVKQLGKFLLGPSKEGRLC